MTDFSVPPTRMDSHSRRMEESTQGLSQEEIDSGIRIDTTDNIPRHMTFVNSKYRKQENIQTWANRTSINVSPKKPPLIDFEALKEERKMIKYSSLVEEVDKEFEKTKRWLGVRMNISEV